MGLEGNKGPENGEGLKGGMKLLIESEEM